MSDPLFDRQRVQSILADEDIDVLIACRPENFRYISAVCRPLEHSFVHEHTTYAMVSRDGEVAVVVPFFELESVQEEVCTGDMLLFRQFAGTAVDEQSDVARGESVESEVAKKVSQLGSHKGRIGFDENFTSVCAFERLREQLPHACLVPASHVFDRIRQVKTAVEIERLRKSARIVELAYEAMFEVVREGVTERELAAEAHRIFYLNGAPPVTFLHCGAGLRSSIEHLQPSDYACRDGDIIRFDMGVRYGGYHSDIGRTFVCGKPSADQVDIYRRIFDAYQNVIAAMKPGVLGRDVFEVYRRGMGELFTVFPMVWVAHGVGLEIHEPPFLGPQMDEPLEPGMLFAVEIVVDFPGREGYHVEDPILITETGNRRLIDLHNESLVVN